MMRPLSLTLGLVVLLALSSSGVTAPNKVPGPFQGLVEAAEPFQALLDMSVPAGFRTIFSVPPGTRAQVEYLSIRVEYSAAPDTQSGVYLRVFTIFDGEEAEHALPLIDQGGNAWVASHKVLFHADPGTDVELLPTGGCGALTCNVRATVSGFLFNE